MVFFLIYFFKIQLHYSILCLLGIEVYNFFNLFYMELSKSHDLNHMFNKLT
jgi:hypothetical protein